MTYQNTLQFAQQFDQEDPIKEFKNLFHLPVHEGKQQIYMCGNSLGLQPKSVRQYLNNELNKWQNLGVEGWFEGEDNWINYLQNLKGPLVRIVGGKPLEVTVMNNSTVNLYLMMVSFY